MINIYEKYGYYKEGLVSITMKGIEGAEKIKEILEKIRNNPPKKLGDYKILEARDYNTKRIINYAENKEYESTLPKSNVIYYDLNDSAWCCIRPSGTEPKIKFYMGVKGNSMEDSDKKLAELKEAVNKLVEK
jgi:phosphoglucomutase